MNPNFRHIAMSSLGALALLSSGGDQRRWRQPTASAVTEMDLPAISTASVASLAPQELAMPAAPRGLEADAVAEKLVRDSFLRGDFAEVERLFKIQLEDPDLSAAYKGWLNAQQLTVRLGRAWALIRQKNCAEALPLLESMPDPSAQYLALKGLGFCYLQKKDFASANSNLENYLERNKSDPEAYVLLAEVKESLGETTEALELAQRASALQNLTEEETRELQKRETSLNAKAEESAGQVELTAGFIHLRYQSLQHQSLVSGSLQVLQKTIETLNLQLGLPYPDEPIEVIFHQSENFGRISHGPAWTAGLYDGRVRIPVPADQAFDQDFAKVLRHEITHAVLAEHAQHRNLPTWFQEGLAQVAECPELCWHYSFAATSFPFLPAQAFDAGFMKLNKGEAQVAYRQSFYLMQVLYFRLGLNGIKLIIEQIPGTQDLSSDGLMNPLGFSFAALHQKAQEYWLAQTSF